MGTSVNQSQIQFRRFQPSDRDWLVVWFQDEWLYRALGPLDDEWFECILNSSDGVQLVAEINHHPIGLVGITWATFTNPHHGITDLAVAPPLRFQGLGRLILAEAIKWPEHPPTNEWIAYVAEENTPPAGLLLSMGWIEKGKKNGMRCFSLCVR